MSLETRLETPPAGAPGAPAAAPFAGTAPSAPLLRPNARFMLRHPAHLLALGFGSGLAPLAPGTVGTLWGWAAFAAADALWPGLPWGWVILAGLPLGVWACTVTARHMGLADPGAIVWDEILAIWLVLWLWAPAGAWAQLLAFTLFRVFDALKPGPVGWADRRYKLRPGQAIGWRQGWGIVFDDLVAAFCTLLVLALLLRAWQAW